MTKTDMIARHLAEAGSISIREAMDDYSMSGGHLTKIISLLRHERGLIIAREWKEHPITGDRYARYYLTTVVRVGKYEAARYLDRLGIAA